MRFGSAVDAAGGAEFRDLEVVGVEEVDHDGFRAGELAEGNDWVEIEKMSNGGSALTEDTEVAVIATGRPPASAVMTATPAGCPQKAALNSSGDSEESKPGLASADLLAVAVFIIPSGF